MRLLRLSEVLAERRRSPRREAKFLNLAYWNGSEGVLRRVAQVSSYGAYVETSDRWYRGTVMQTQLVADVPLASVPIERIGRDRNPAAEPNPAEAVLPADSEATVVGEVGPESDDVDGSEAVDAPAASAAKPEIAETETFSLPIMAKVVRAATSGICVEFLFRDKREHRALIQFLMAVEERRKIVEAREAKAGEKPHISAARSGSRSIPD